MDIIENIIIGSFEDGSNESLYWNGSFPNTTDSGEPYVPYEHRIETYIVPIVFLAIFIVGVLGNGTLILIFANNPSMRNIPNTYILSLAVGDFLVIIGSVPFTSTIYTFDSWPYGIVICKLSEFLKDVSSGVTVLTLTLLSADRFIAIVKPLQKLTIQGGRTFTVILAISMWIISIFAAIPGTYFSYIWKVRLENGKVIDVCYPFPEELFPWYPQTIVLAKFLLLYAIPLCFITTFYSLMARQLCSNSSDALGSNESQQRKMASRAKVARIVLVFVVIFAVCFFPTHMFFLWFYFYPNAPDYYSGFWHSWKIMGHVLAFANSCMNPIALYLISSKFRNHFRSYFISFYFCKRNGETTSDTQPTTSLRSTMRTAITSRI